MFISYCQHRHSTPNPKAPALWMQDVSASYEDVADRVALKNISLSVTRGSSTALVGPNGAGKSTLFKVAANLLKNSSGKVEIFGQPLGACHQRVVYLPQRSGIDWEFPLSVLDLVTTGRYVYLGWLRSLEKKDYDKAWEALKSLSIEDLAHRQIAQLSGGQQQRVLIARALAQDADLLLLDEPLNAVDVQTRHIVQRVLNEQKAQGKTTIVATHYFKQEEGLYDNAVYLKDGEICTAS
ncbi:MAG: ATP-binding cassette domain-containing protein [Candidatus Omnitrophica bacterium]|nr:ATP-binding cassette domain-containing protein [Candidatus Omnitrophota bacterium]